MPLTPSETRKVLNLLGHRPKKKLGQNFLIDGNIVQKSIDLSNLEAPSEVLEIGPGLGTLTEGLLKQGHAGSCSGSGQKTCWLFGRKIFRLD